MYCSGPVFPALAGRHGIHSIGTNGQAPVHVSGNTEKLSRKYGLASKRLPKPALDEEVILLSNGWWLSSIYRCAYLGLGLFLSVLVGKFFVLSDKKVPARFRVDATQALELRSGDR